MKRIGLTQGEFALVDDDDYESVARHTWHLLRSKDYKYARNERLTLLHVFIMGERFIDHIDRDGLNCQRHNMRKATKSQNAANSSHYNPTGYRGVVETKGRNGIPNGIFKAQIMVDRKKRYLGNYDSAEDAAHAYDVAAIEAFGEFATLNFPDEWS